MNNEQSIESLQELTDSISDICECALNVKKGTDEEIDVQYKQGVNDDGMSAGIFTFLVSEFKKRGLLLTRISVENEKTLSIVFSDPTR